MNLNLHLRIFAALLCSMSAESVLQCFTGHSHYATQCTSQSYCVTITSKNGPVQRSCDGNSISQISLCSMYAMHGIPRTIQSDYSNFPISLKGPNAVPPQPPSRNSRRAPTQMCFNAGDLGDVCCCNTDYCNSAQKSRFILFVIFIASHLLLTS